MALKLLHSAATLWRGMVLDSRLWRRNASALSQRGYEVLSDPLLDENECDRLAQLLKGLTTENSRALGASASLVRRRDGGDRDTRVSQVMNAHEIDAGLRRLFESGQLELLLSERLNEAVVVESITLQLDEVDTTTKRGFHIDRFTPPSLKVFVYLNDVVAPGDGPYTVVPGSQRHVMRKLVNAVMNKLRGHPLTDMNNFYSDSKAEMILGTKGTTILSIQTMVHKGWHHQDHQPRAVLIAYCALARKPTHKHGFTLGREIVESAKCRSAPYRGHSGRSSQVRETDVNPG